MKMIFVGVFTKRSTNVSQVAGFKRAGVKVIRYAYRDRASKIGNHKRDSELIKLCKRVRPAFVFFSKCESLNARVFAQCSKVARTVLWYMDPFTIMDRPGFLDNLQKCHIACCALWTPYREFRRLHPHAHFLQEGFDQAVDYPATAEQIHDVSFIGHLRNEKRLKYFEAIGFHSYTGAFGRAHARAVAASRINLNFAEGGTSDRTYKVLAARGFLLTQPWPNMTADFKPGRDLATFSDIDHLKKLIAYYLAHPAKREKIAASGHEVVQKFNRNNFAKRVLAIVKASKEGPK